MDAVQALTPPGRPGDPCDPLAARLGNRCGHDPRNPVVKGLLRTGKGGHPAILSRALDRIVEWYRRPAQNPIDRGKGKGCAMRSERREGILRLAEAMLYRLELNSRCLGTPNTAARPYGFIDASMNDLAEKSGLGKRRCERAMRELTGAGFVTSKRRSARTVEGNYYGLRAIRKVENAFLEFLGLVSDFSVEAAKARDRLAEKAKRAGLASLKAFYRRVGMVAGAVKKQPGRPSRAEREKAVSWNMALAEALAKDPDKAPEEFYRDVNARLGLPEDYHP